MTYVATTNIAIGILCLLPVIFLVWFTIKIAVNKPSKDTIILNTDVLISQFTENFSKIREDQLKNISDDE